MRKFIQLFASCYENITAEIVISALIYIDRLLAMHEEIGATLTECNGKGLLHVALTLATKFCLDRYEKNTIFYGAVVGMDRRQMRRMTDAFLCLIDFEMYISQEEYREAAVSINQLITETYEARGQIVIQEKNVRVRKAMPTTPELTTYKSNHSASTNSSSAHDNTEHKEPCNRPVNLKTDHGGYASNPES